MFTLAPYIIFSTSEIDTVNDEARSPTIMPVTTKPIRVQTMANTRPNFVLGDRSP